MRYITANIGDSLLIGHDAGRTVVQSMCNCDTNDLDAAVQQCLGLYEAGSQLVRLTTQGLREVESLGKIKARLRAMGVPVPLVADVHFSSDVAIAAAAVADKVRINPGNFAKDHEVACSQFCRFLEECRRHGTANVVLSLKASNVPVMTQAYILLQQWMEERGIIFPLHLGVTEAGNGDMGRIKSAAGLATLLSRGIGDTIRVSLTEPPVNEIVPARLIRAPGQ